MQCAGFPMWGAGFRPPGPAAAAWFPQARAAGSPGHGPRELRLKGFRSFVAWDPPRPEIEPMPHASACGPLATVLPGNSRFFLSFVFGCNPGWSPAPAWKVPVPHCWTARKSQVYVFLYFLFKRLWLDLVRCRESQLHLSRQNF